MVSQYWQQEKGGGEKEKSKNPSLMNCNEKGKRVASAVGHDKNE